MKASNKKYNDDQIKKLRKFLKKRIINPEFKKWNHNTFSMIFALAYNNKIPEDMAQNARALTIKYMFLITKIKTKTKKCDENVIKKYYENIKKLNIQL